MTPAETHFKTRLDVTFDSVDNHKRKHFFNLSINRDNYVLFLIPTNFQHISKYVLCFNLHFCDAFKVKGDVQ